MSFFICQGIAPRRIENTIKPEFYPPFALVCIKFAVKGKGGFKVCTTTVHLPGARKGIGLVGTLLSTFRTCPKDLGTR